MQGVHQSIQLLPQVRQALGLSGPGPWCASESRRLGVAVLSWDDLFAALGQGASDQYLYELEQLESMYRVLIGDNIAPLAGLEDLRQWRERETDFVRNRLHRLGQRRFFVRQVMVELGRIARRAGRDDNG